LRIEAREQRGCGSVDESFAGTGAVGVMNGVFNGLMYVLSKRLDLKHALFMSMSRRITNTSKHILGRKCPNSKHGFHRLSKIESF
jgi:hypothetical protein